MRRARIARTAAAAILAGALAWPRSVSADTVSVPVGLQVDLFTKVADYDKTLLGRAEGVVRVLVVIRSRVPESASIGARVLNALSSASRISGLPHEDSSVEFTDVASLVARCKAHSIGILYMTPGLTDVDEALARALADLPVLSVSASAEGVTKGMTLGFDLVGAKPKLLVNLSACRRQGVQLSSDVLKIATVVE
ncbi:MAG: YfiR family protein [Myxococcota bacterium]|nr:YfiR family protein [Myxococcota bacterium]